MPAIPRPGKATVYAHVPTALKEAFEAFARERGSTLAAQVELAMRRHLEYRPRPARAAPLPGAAAQAAPGQAPETGVNGRSEIPCGKSTDCLDDCKACGKI